MISASNPIRVSLFALLVAQPAAAEWRFDDSFNGQTTWGKFEERVNTCSAPPGVDVGLVQNAAAPASAGGGAVLEVSANAAGTHYGSHVIAKKRLLEVGPRGRWRYRARVWVDADTIGLTQAGPEFSVQSTYPVGLDTGGLPIWRTHTAGLQYVGNEYDVEAHGWQLWTVDNSSPAGSNADVARWVRLPPAGDLAHLDVTGWWEVELDFDYDQNEYVGVSARYEGAPSAEPQSLAGWRIARENKFSDPALWATLEAENLYDCNLETNLQNDVWQNAVYYDDVSLEQVAGTVPSPPVASDQTFNAFVGDTLHWSLSELADDADGNLDPTTLRVLYPPPDQEGQFSTERGEGEFDATGLITYTPQQPGGEGILYRVCDATFYCTEAWLTLNVPNRPPIAEDPVIYLNTNVGNAFNDIALHVVDLDNNLAQFIVDVPTDFGVAEVISNTTLRYTTPSSAGQASFHVLACDANPWGWCAGVWVVIDVKGPHSVGLRGTSSVAASSSSMAAAAAPKGTLFFQHMGKKVTYVPKARETKPRPHNSSAELSR